MSSDMNVEQAKKDLQYQLTDITSSHVEAYNAIRAAVEKIPEELRTGTMDALRVHLAESLENKLKKSACAYIEKLNNS